MSFSGLVIDSSILCRRVRNFESSLVPVLRLRQVVNGEWHSDAMELAMDHVTCELNSVRILKKIMLKVACLVKNL